LVEIYVSKKVIGKYIYMYYENRKKILFE